MSTVTENATRIISFARVARKERENERVNYGAGKMWETWMDGELDNWDLLMKIYILKENDRQIEKWGIQVHSPEEWMLYLTEEVGELAQAIAKFRSEGGKRGDIVKEATQVCTLAMKIIEMNITPSLRESGR